MANEAIEAAKLLRELEQEAMKRVEYLILPEEGVLNTTIDFKGFVVSSPLTMQQVQQSYYKLQMFVNGKEIILTGKCDSEFLQSKEKVAQIIAEALIVQLKQKLMEQLQPVLIQFIKQ